MYLDLERSVTIPRNQASHTAVDTLKNNFRFLLHLALFLATFFTTTLAGVQWLNGDMFELSNFPLGLPYSISILAFLSAHEFGHYFAARAHGISTTLPFFIPMPPFLINPFGTMGAVIRIRAPISTKRALFDIGIAGPIAGLIVTLVLLMIGYLTLPPLEYLYTIHPEYRTMEGIPSYGLTFGSSFLLWLMNSVFSTQGFVPPMNEIYHYPFLCVGWFGLFVTALNLIPVGQLDGGHILYALLGKRQGIVARVFTGALIAIGLAGFLPIAGESIILGTFSWLLWAAILIFIIKLDHPEIYDDLPLDPTRTLLGWIILAVFLATFPPVPFYDVARVLTF